jgi:hypothetical protein
MGFVHGRFENDLPGSEWLTGYPEVDFEPPAKSHLRQLCREAGRPSWTIFELYRPMATPVSETQIFGWRSLRLLRSDVLKLEALEISCVSKRYLGCRQKLASAVNDKIGIEPTSGAP